MNTDRYVWLDIETFGLNQYSDPILEIGFKITDVRLEMIDDFQIVLWETDRYDKALMKCDPYVREMHTKSGLLEECQDGGYTMHEGFGEAADFLKGHGVSVSDAICGSSVGFDRSFLEEWSPEIAQLFSYRNVDVSTLKETCARINPGLFAKLDEATDQRKLHRVLPDLDDTIGEYRFYLREFLMWANDDGTFPSDWSW